MWLGKHASKRSADLYVFSEMICKAVHVWQNGNYIGAPYMNGHTEKENFLADSFIQMQLHFQFVKNLYP